MVTDNSLWTFGTPETNRRWVSGVQFSPDGSLLAYSKEGEISIFNVRSGMNVQSFHINNLFAHVVKFSPDGQVIAIGSSSGPIYAFDLASQQLRFKLEGHTTYIRALNFSPDGNTLFSGSQDGTVRTWDMKKGTLTKVTLLTSGNNRQSYLRTIAISPLGDLIAGGWWDQAIRISNLSTGQLVHSISTTGIPERLAFSPDGKMCTAALDSGVLLQISALRADEPPEIFIYKGHKLPDRIESMVDRTIVSTDGHWVISGSKVGAVHFTRPLARSANFVMQGIHWDFDYHPASGVFAGALTNGTVRVWKVDPTVKNHPSRPPTPVRPAYSAEDGYDSCDSFDDPYPWKD